MATPMKREDIMKNAALQMAIDYHRLYDNGASVAAVQKGRAPSRPEPDSVVATAKVFHAFLK